MNLSIYSIGKLVTEVLKMVKLLILILTLFRLGYFGNKQARGGGTLCPLGSVSPLLVIQLVPNLTWWYSGTKSVKSLKNFADIIIMS